MKWPRSKLAIWMLVVLPVLSLAIGIAFSLVVWGYAWSLPRLDSRVERVRWDALCAFTSRPDGSGWQLAGPEQLRRQRIDSAPDNECCETGRILRVIERQRRREDLPPLSQEQLAVVEAGVSTNVTLERGTAGYDFARHLLGIAALGEIDGKRVVFASFQGGQVANDHYPFYEVLLLLRPGSSAELLSTHRYFGDVAGIEGATAPVVAGSVYWLGTVLTLVVMGFVAVGSVTVNFLRRRE